MFSLNEIEAMGRRAAHGAGLDWGIAEESGKASRWLAAHGLPGPELLAGFLKNNENKSYSEVVPVLSDQALYAKSGTLSPLIAGSALSDRAAEIAEGREFELEETLLPILMAPYAAFGAKFQNVTVELSWSGAKLTITSDGGLLVEGDDAAVIAWKADKVVCRLGAKNIETELPAETGRAVDAESWESLNAFAYRAFAPSTESSRMGAGAGLVDND